MKKRNKKNEAHEIAALYTQWIQECEITHSQHTIRLYETTVCAYIKYLTSKGISFSNFSAEECFSRDTILSWRIYLREEKACSPETCNLRLSNLRAFLKYMAEKRPKYASIYTGARDIKPMRAVKKKQYAISDDVMDLIMEAPDAGTRSGVIDVVIISFLYGTAMRIGEMLMVQIRDLNLNGNMPYVHIVGKGNKERIVYVPEKTRDTINDYIRIFHGKNPDPNAFLFYSRVKGKQEPMTDTAVRKRLNKIEMKIKEENPTVKCHIHPHAFRRTRATNLSDDGMNPFQVSKILGHANLSSTMRYVDVGLRKKEMMLMDMENDADRDIEPLWKGREECLEDLFKRRGDS